MHGASTTSRIFQPENGLSTTNSQPYDATATMHTTTKACDNLMKSDITCGASRAAGWEETNQ